MAASRKNFYAKKRTARVPNVCPTLGSSPDITIRYIYLRDIWCDERNVWAAVNLSPQSILPFADDGVESLSRHPEGYDALIIGGNDIPRLGKFLKANHAAIRGVPKVCLTHGANAQDRAHAIMLGFDDVFDSATMVPDEAILRLKSLLRRYTESRPLIGQAQEVE